MTFLTSKFFNFANKKTLLVSGKIFPYKSNRCISTKASSISIPSEGDFVKNKVLTVNYFLDSFHRSNQDTCLLHKPAVYEGQWVESGDLLADCSASLGGELSLGQNILIAYMPWEGYNFEDAILISERLVYDDLYTSIHIEKYEMEIRETKLGIEQITREIPEIQEKELENLDSSGIAKLGSWVQEGDILVGKITPINKKGQSPYQKLLYTILEKQFLPIRDSSLRAPKGIKAKVIGIQIFKNENNTSPTKVSKKTNKVSKKLKILTNSNKINKTNVLVKNQENLKKVNPKFNLEELKDTNSLGFKTLSGNTKSSLFKKSKFFFNSKGLLLNNQIKDSIQKFTNGKNFDLKNSFIYAMNTVKPTKNKFNNGTPRKGNKNQSNTNLTDIYFIKKLQAYAFSRSKKTLEKYKGFDIDKHSNQGIIIPSKNNKLKDSVINNYTGLKTSNIKLLPSGFKKNCRFRELYFKKKSKKKSLNNISLSSIHIFLAEKRKVQIGDKMAGRHGNKGIVSQILPREDMPYLPDGTPLDMILNPLGVPSRMNVGQIYECLLGFAGKYLGENFKVFPFDEIYGPEASRSFVYSKLFEARVKTGLDWLYDPNNPGKIRLYDGRTGESFDQAITVGDSYILRLVHMVDDKIHARSTGPYSLVTQQPLRGRSKQGGQRLGEMEVWALEGYGAAFTLLEMLTIKSDDLTGRMTLWSNLILNKDISIGTPESFKVLVCELQALCLDIGLFRPNPAYTIPLKEIESLMDLA
jgi:DNA-directed RNA polymerase beta subunit